MTYWLTPWPACSTTRSSMKRARATIDARDRLVACGSMSARRRQPSSGAASRRPISSSSTCGGGSTWTCMARHNATRTAVPSGAAVRSSCMIHYPEARATVASVRPTRASRPPRCFRLHYPPMTDEQQRIRGYLQAQAAKQTPAEIIAKVEAAMADLAKAARAVPAVRFAERPEPAEWSANEVLAHVVAADTYFGGGIAAILQERSPGPPRGRASPENAPIRTADAWLEILRGQRKAVFDHVRAADPDA